MFASIAQAAAQLPSLPLASGAPAWIWATLLMAAFVAITALTMWLIRFPLRRTPPPVPPPPRELPETDEQDGDR